MTHIDLESSYYRNLMLNNPTPETSGTESGTELDTSSPTSNILAIPIVQKSFRNEISLSIQSKIWALRQVASWPFRKIVTKLGIPLTRVFNISQQPSTPHRPCMGHLRLLTTPMRKRLIQYATVSWEISWEAGILVNERTLRQGFADEGWHRRVVCVKQFLSAAAKIKRLDWANNVHDWAIEDFRNVIWTDECTFNVGEFTGNTWVTR